MKHLGCQSSRTISIDPGCRFLASMIELGADVNVSTWPTFTGRRMGKARQLCPGISDVNSFGYRQGIVDFDAQVSDRAFDFCVANQELNGP